MYFLLAWFNALVQERLRYAPLGWAKKYEFNESDLRMACDTLDTWLELIAQVLTKTMKIIVNKITCFQRVVVIFLQIKSHGLLSKHCCHNAYMVDELIMTLIRCDLCFDCREI